MVYRLPTLDLTCSNQKLRKSIPGIFRSHPVRRPVDGRDCTTYHLTVEVREEKITLSSSMRFLDVFRGDSNRFG